MGREKIKEENDGKRVREREVQMMRGLSEI